MVKYFEMKGHGNQFGVLDLIWSNLSIEFSNSPLEGG
jgi:hypothetical protein